MKNVKSANYWQIDHKIKQIYEKRGTVILPSSEAWEKFKWVKKYFPNKPKEGYFIWVKKQIDFPLFVCISIGTKKIQQSLENLLIVEKNLRISLQGTCDSLKKNLCGIHKAQGKIVLKEESSLKYNHLHSWDKKDVVEPNYEFILEKNSKLDYTYKNLFTPKKLKINTLLTLFEGASCDIKIVVNGIQTKAEIKDTLVLREKGTSGIVKLRLVGREKSNISAYSQILAAAQSKGHLDCRGLLVDKASKISLTPQLICQNKNAQLTHEASIGKISEDELNYLRMRGLTQNEALKLILTGFLGVK